MKHYATLRLTAVVQTKEKLGSGFHDTILKGCFVEVRGTFCTAHGPCLIAQAWLVFLGSADYINAKFE